MFAVRPPPSDAAWWAALTNPQTLGGRLAKDGALEVRAITRRRAHSVTYVAAMGPNVFMLELALPSLCYTAGRRIVAGALDNDTRL